MFGVSDIFLKIEDYDFGERVMLNGKHLVLRVRDKKTSKRRQKY